MNDLHPHCEFTRTKSCPGDQLIDNVRRTLLTGFTAQVSSRLAAMPPAAWTLLPTDPLWQWIDTHQRGIAEPGDHNAEVLSDADLASLAIDGERYRRNSADIRLEFAHVDEHLFRAGRAAIIAALLAGPSLYRTRVGRQRWEDAARANLKAELDALTGP